MKPQYTDKIKNFLKSGRMISKAEAVRWFNCYHLADVIYRLRLKHWNIETVECKKFVRYKLVK